MKRHVAKKFFDEHEGTEKLEMHCDCVIECCCGMAKETDLNQEVFVVAGWLHDLGKEADAEKHHELGVRIFQEFLQQYPQYDSLKMEIEDCILHHRRSGEPQTIYGMIFRAADKVAKHKLRYMEWKRKRDG